MVLAHLQCESERLAHTPKYPALTSRTNVLLTLVEVSTSSPLWCSDMTYIDAKGVELVLHPASSIAKKDQ
jgi:hypothetical protein